MIFQFSKTIFRHINCLMPETDIIWYLIRRILHFDFRIFSKNSSFFENVYFFDPKRLRQINSKTKSPYTVAKIERVMCTCYCYSNGFKAIKKWNTYFPKMSVFFITQSAHFDRILSSAHGHIERIGGSTAIDLTFMIPMHHWMIPRVLFI